ncbi:MAG: response regulator transcription factor [Erysipelotrichaceae bacterium]|nr:response regulator transcription factor [Erysipelotrichaceae bacterium]
MRILIVEDEYKLAELMEVRLKKENYSVDIVTNGEDGLYSALTGTYDLIVLDVMLPKKNGFEILSEIRKQQISSKVIMLTALGSLDHKLEGFSEGADDYLTKPFMMEELVARINARLRNTYRMEVNAIEYEDLKLDLRKTSVLCTTTKKEIEIMKKELQILEYFMRNPNQVLSKELLYDKVWGFDNDTISNNLEAYVSFVRKKLKAIGSTVTIRAVRGLGYKLEVGNEETKE